MVILWTAEVGSDSQLCIDKRNRGNSKIGGKSKQNKSQNKQTQAIQLTIPKFLEFWLLKCARGHYFSLLLIFFTLLCPIASPGLA